MRQLLLCPPEPLQNVLVVKSHTVQVNVDFLPIAPGHGLCPTPGAAVVESGVVEPYGSWAQWIHLYPHTTLWNLVDHAVSRPQFTHLQNGAC